MVKSVFESCSPRLTIRFVSKLRPIIVALIVAVTFTYVAGPESIAYKVCFKFNPKEP